jgi:hypothetical protein
LGSFIVRIAKLKQESRALFGINPEFQDVPGLYCAFAEFADLKSAASARKLMDRRVFGSQTVEVLYFSETLFELRDFSEIAPNTEPSRLDREIISKPTSFQQI